MSHVISVIQESLPKLVRDFFEEIVVSQTRNLHLNFPAKFWSQA